MGNKFQTPDLCRLDESVYDPSDDTFLLLDALELEYESLSRLKPRLCIEIGSGSGCVITFLCKMLGSTSCCYLATDINDKACAATAATAAKNGASVDVVCTDLLEAVRERLRGKVDVAVFNPPYVPTLEHETGRRDIYASWAGGRNGTDTLERLMPVLGEVLSADGCFYCVVLEQNKPDQICRRMKECGISSAKVVKKQRTIEESLSVLKFSRS